MENHANGYLSVGNLNYIDTSVSKAAPTDENVQSKTVGGKTRAGALGEMKAVDFSVSDDISNTVKVSISQSDDIDRIMDRVGRAFGVSGSDIHHIVVVDQSNAERSAAIFDADGFWAAHQEKYSLIPKSKFMAVFEEKKKVAVDRSFEVNLSLSADCSCLCAANPTRRVAIPWGADWAQLSKIFTDSFDFPVASVEYFLIVDGDGDEMSSLLNTPDKFWKAASSFKAMSGCSLQVYLEDATFESIRSYVERQKFLMQSENFTIVMDCDKACRAELFLPTNASWTQLRDEIVMTLGLDNATTLKKVVLQDADYCPISADINTDSKFWKIYSGKYKMTHGCHFSVTVTEHKRQQKFFEACAHADKAPALLSIIKQGVDVNEICEDSSIVGGDAAELHSGIHLAIMNNNASAIRILCSLDCLELNSPDVCGMTPLHLVCGLGNLDLTSLLCEKGAVFRGHNTLGKTALHCFAERGYDPCRAPNLKLGKVLVAEGPGKIPPLVVNAHDHNSLTALMIACKRGDLTVAKGLVECGAIINIRDSSGMSPLLYAVHAGSLVVARYLLDQGASLSARNNAGEDAFMMCAITGNFKLAEFLMGMQLDFDTRNHAGENLRDVAAACGNIAIADWFSSNGSGKKSFSAKALTHLVDTDISLEKRLRAEEIATIEAILGAKPPVFDGPSVAAKGIRAVLANEPVAPAAAARVNIVKKGIPPKDSEPAKLLPKAAAPVENPKMSDVKDPVSIDNNFSRSIDECPSPDKELSEERPQLSSASSSSSLSPVDDYDFGGLDGSSIYGICNSGNKDKIEKLFASGANLNAVDNDGSDFTALHSACEKGNLKVVQSLLTNNCNPNPYSFDGETPLYLACSHGYVAIAKALAGVGVDITAKVKDTTVLHAAAANMHLDMVTWLVKQEKFPVDALNDAGFTALHETCRLNDSLMARLLVNLGAWVDARENNAPLHVACFMGHIDLAKWLVTKGANPNTMYRGRNCFFIACSGAQLAVAKWLDAIGTDIHACDTNDGCSALHAACMAEEGPLCEWLMNKSDNFLRLRNSNDESAYCIALRTRDGELVNLIEKYLQKGIPRSIFEAQIKDELVDMLAKTVEEQNINISNFILQRLLNIVPVTYVCSDGCTPLHFAAAIGNVTVMNFLISKGALVDAKSLVGKAPIHYAAITGNVEAGICLANAGANIMATDKDARDASMFAKYFKQKKFSKWFKTHPTVIKARTPSSSFFSVFSCVSSATKDDDISDDSEERNELFQESPN